MEVCFHLIREAASGKRVVGPEVVILDQEPVVDFACGRGERLIVVARKVRTERPIVQSASWTTRQMTWPVVIGWLGSTESSETVLFCDAVISFFIFIASTTQTTWPGCTSSPSVISTASTVLCIGLTIASRAAP